MREVNPRSSPRDAAGALPIPKGMPPRDPIPVRLPPKKVLHIYSTIRTYRQLAIYMYTSINIYICVGDQAIPMGMPPRDPIPVRLPPKKVLYTYVGLTRAVGVYRILAMYMYISINIYMYI